MNENSIYNIFSSISVNSKKDAIHGELLNYRSKCLYCIGKILKNPNRFVVAEISFNEIRNTCKFDFEFNFENNGIEQIDFRGSRSKLMPQSDLRLKPGDSLVAN